MKFKSIIIYVVSAILALLSISVSAQEMKNPSLKQFDEDVAVCRRTIRQYCAIVQEMMSTDKLDAVKQAKGLEHLKEADIKWKAVQERYSSLPPVEYAKDKTFKARLQDVKNAVGDMESALASGDVRRSFMACSFMCDLFVKMHEDNGLEYALDKLFHLRKTAKTANAVLKAKGIDAVRELIPELMQERDDVLIAEAPWPESDSRSSSYRDAVKELSAAVDELAVAVSAGSIEAASRLLQGMMATVSKPYGLAL